MTKRRAPLTIEEAIDRAIGNLTMASAVEATGRSASYLRALSDPDKRETLTVVDMVKIDTAHIGLDGTTPIFDLVATILKAAQAGVYSDAAELAVEAVEVMREHSEAERALVEAAAPGADDAAWARAEKELADTVPRNTRLLGFIRQVRSRASRPP